jgi:hypothetical protein
MMQSASALRLGGPDAMIPIRNEVGGWRDFGHQTHPGRRFCARTGAAWANPGTGPGVSRRGARDLTGAARLPERDLGHTNLHINLGGKLMSKVIVGRENSADIEIYYKDHGAGQPVVLIHGYPLPDDHLRPAQVRAIQPPPRSPPRSPASAPGPTDFRDDLPKIDVPMLILHGDADQVLPLHKTSKRLPGLIKDVQLTIVEGGLHAITWTHAEQVNTALCNFLRR